MAPGPTPRPHLAALFCSIFVVLVPASLIPASAAEMLVPAGGDCQIIVRGEIKDGDLGRLNEVLSGLEERRDARSAFSPVICLNSEGGSFREALDIAESMLQRQSVSTRIEADGRCLSACAIIFMAGHAEGNVGSTPSRTLHIKAMLGFHAPYMVIRGGRYDKNTVQNAYRAAVRELGRLIRLSEQRWENTGAGRHIIEPWLIAEMLLRESGELYYVDTVARARDADIKLSGYAPPTRIDEEAYGRICNNVITNLALSVFGGSAWIWNSEPKVAASGDGTQYTGLTYGFEGDYSCAMTVDNRWGRPRASVLISGSRRDNVGQGQRFDAPDWYIYGPAAKLACLSNDASAECYSTRAKKVLGAASSELGCIDFYRSEVCAGIAVKEEVRNNKASNIGVPVVDRLVNVAFHYGGQDATNAANYDVCANRCIESTTCQAFTYFKTRKLCRLMGSATELMPDPRADSGIKRH